MGCFKSKSHPNLLTANQSNSTQSSDLLDLLLAIDDLPKFNEISTVKQYVNSTKNRKNGKTPQGMAFWFELELEDVSSNKATNSWHILVISNPSMKSKTFMLEFEKKLKCSNKELKGNQQAIYLNITTSTKDPLEPFKSKFRPTPVQSTICYASDGLSLLLNLNLTNALDEVYCDNIENVKSHISHSNVMKSDRMTRRIVFWVLHCTTHKAKGNINSCNSHCIHILVIVDASVKIDTILEKLGHQLECLDQQFKDNEPSKYFMYLHLNSSKSKGIRK